ncbi:cob(I)yrinic acid a,c-diamide adenosyltransferase [Clostridium sp. C105KSO13]|uniref:cob(I)yrinic acid a,c-diamide adenosyltransferase n=1 Tax=Clostridium sp. C105KSO13 TaxID=1776045 RepID=UPI0007406C79|nr:cob(I)yrinic acid a,c-diamide adenosyltransferase [Clostridium sp. C105KSO13]CUX32375.1 Cob(I)yrinic acid a,c-diamide adenosyltransferase [Clostridium sp. C105KSO13]
MKIYTKGGDKGKTSLMNGIRVSKCDTRVELLGTIDELNSHIGLAKVIAESELRDHLSKIQRELMLIMGGIADPRNPEYRVSDEQIQVLEKEIDRMENSFPRPELFVLYGGCEQSARLDVARAVARRAERRFNKVAQNYGADSGALKYINRLSDFLYETARYADYKASSDSNDEIMQEVIKNVMQTFKKQ